jgi:hypothetical protein
MIRSKFLFLCLAVAGLALPCQARANPDPAHIEIVGNGQRVKMTPNGFDTNHPSQDTINLQWVFDNYPTSDIDLEEGTFHISNTIEAVNYQGTIGGMGRDKTFIVGRGPLVDGEYVFPMLNEDLTERLYPPGVPHFIWFHPAEGDVNAWKTNNVDVSIKALTMRMDGLGPEITFFGVPVRTMHAFLIVTGSEAVINAPVGDVSHVKFEMKDVDMQAQEVAYTLNDVERKHANAGVGVIVYGGEHWVPAPGLNGFFEIDHSPVNAIVNVRNCEFDNFHQFAVAVEASYTTNPGTDYTFPDSPAFSPSSIIIKDNTFNRVGDSMGMPGAFGFNALILSPSETHIVIKDNILNDVPTSGIALVRGVAITIPELSSNVTIKDNTVNMIANPLNSAAIDVFDLTFFNNSPLIVNVKDNTFVGGPGYQTPLVRHAMGTLATFHDNMFFGEAESGISVGNTVSPLPPHELLPSVQNTVSDNDFSGLSASVANIILGPASAANTVIVSDPDDVIDQGVGNMVIIDN